jgi:DNA-binding response OmpR family regulator
VKSEDGDLLHLTQAEYRILALLVRNPGRVIVRDDLMSAAAGRDWDPMDRSIDVHVSNLRKKLDLDPDLPSLIRTVRGAGYMFVPKRN